MIYFILRGISAEEEYPEEIIDEVSVFNEYYEKATEEEIAYARSAIEEELREGTYTDDPYFAASITDFYRDYALSVGKLYAQIGAACFAASERGDE